MPVAAATLPPFSNMRAVYARCGARWGIRVHFDRDCALVRGDPYIGRAGAATGGAMVTLRGDRM